MPCPTSCSSISRSISHFCSQKLSYSACGSVCCVLSECLPPFISQSPPPAALAVGVSGSVSTAPKAGGIPQYHHARWHISARTRRGTAPKGPLTGFLRLHASALELRRSHGRQPIGLGEVGVRLCRGLEPVCFPAGATGAQAQPNWGSTRSSDAPADRIVVILGVQLEDIKTLAGALTAHTPIFRGRWRFVQLL